MTGSPTRALHVRQPSHARMAWLTRTSCPLSPCLSTLFKKISTPSDRHRGMTFHSSWAFYVLEACEKPVAPAGYKNKQTVSYTLPRATEDLHYFNGIISE